MNFTKSFVLAVLIAFVVGADIGCAARSAKPVVVGENLLVKFPEGWIGDSNPVITFFGGNFSLGAGVMQAEEDLRLLYPDGLTVADRIRVDSCEGWMYYPVYPVSDDLKAGEVVVFEVPLRGGDVFFTQLARDGLGEETGWEKDKKEFITFIKKGKWTKKGLCKK